MYLEALGHRTVTCNQRFLSQIARFPAREADEPPNFPAAEGSNISPAKEDGLVLYEIQAFHRLIQFVYIILLLKYEEAVHSFLLPSQWLSTQAHMIATF